MWNLPPALTRKASLLPTIVTRSLAPSRMDGAVLLLLLLLQLLQLTDCCFGKSQSEGGQRSRRVAGAAPCLRSRNGRRNVWTAIPYLEHACTLFPALQRTGNISRRKLEYETEYFQFFHNCQIQKRTFPLTHSILTSGCGCRCTCMRPKAEGWTLSMPNEQDQSKSVS